MHKERVALYKSLEEARKSKVIVYVTGDRPQLETRMSSEVVDLVVRHLDGLGVVDRISLVLYTRGGDTLAAWSLANLIRMFCNTFEVIAPSKCHSAGTLLCLGADQVVMTKQATLGPIDPSVTTPLNPQLPGGQATARAPVSVEDVNAFLQHAAEAVKPEDMGMVFQRLSQDVHPLVLGKAFRARSQIRMLGRRLLNNHIGDDKRIEGILEFLCSESGSHDYTINRREAVTLGLPVEKPSQALYELLQKLYDDIAGELQLTTPYTPHSLLGGNQQANYSFTRAIVESVGAGAHAFVSEGMLSRRQIQAQPGVLQDAISDDRHFEGWRHQNA